MILYYIYNNNLSYILQKEVFENYYQDLNIKLKPFYIKAKNNKKSFDIKIFAIKEILEDFKISQYQNMLFLDLDTFINKKIFFKLPFNQDFLFVYSAINRLPCANGGIFNFTKKNIDIYIQIYNEILKNKITEFNNLLKDEQFLTYLFYSYNILNLKDFVEYEFLLNKNILKNFFSKNLKTSYINYLKAYNISNNILFIKGLK